jgi:biotin operon repressor
MSQYDVETALHRLQQLGVDTSTLNEDYYKIPLENIDRYIDPKVMAYIREKGLYK